MPTAFRCWLHPSLILTRQTKRAANAARFVNAYSGWEPRPYACRALFSPSNR